MNRYLLASGLLLGVLLCAPAQQRKQPPAPVAVEGLVASNTSFGIDLYHRFRAETKGNLFFSPVSLVSALGLASVGAEGQTRKQMLSVLHFPDRDDNEPFAAFVAGLSMKNARGTHVELATGLWAQKGTAFEDRFLKLGRATGAQVEPLDFLGHTEPSRRSINDWVTKKTHNKVKELLPSGSVGRATRLVLASAVHFKGAWEHPFRKESTQEADFHGSTSKAKVQLMVHRREFPYGNPAGVHVLELPFAGGELGMVFLLPAARGGLASVEKQLNAGNLAGWLRTLQTRRVDVFLPRFKMGVQYPLALTLTAMGMKDAFGPKADLKGISKAGNLYLSEAFHRADVNVNEEGAEAAAATAVTVTAKSAGPRVPVFRADHPFVFLVRDRRNGCVLFLGRVAQPKA
ncbi:MAG: serpin family protein [Gemmataceae bacterium]